MTQEALGKRKRSSIQTWRTRCYTRNPETTHRRRKNPSGTEIIYFLKTEESRCNLGIKKHRTDHKDGN